MIKRIDLIPFVREKGLKPDPKISTNSFENKKKFNGKPIPDEVLPLLK